jgi:hypothetical protein
MSRIVAMLGATILLASCASTSGSLLLEEKGPIEKVLGPPEITITCPPPYGKMAMVDRLHLFYVRFENMPDERLYLKIQVQGGFEPSYSRIGVYGFTERYIRFNHELYAVLLFDQVRKRGDGTGPVPVEIDFTALRIHLGQEEVVATTSHRVLLVCQGCPG